MSAAIHFLPPAYRALVIGSSGSIGHGFCDYFENDASCERLVPISRSLCPGFDLRQGQSIEALAQSLATVAPFHMIVDATGALTIEGRGPEKALAALSELAFLEQFKINALGPALLLKALAPLLAQGPAVYAKLSARVGSISDNRKGGWYSYRASKAALNMLLQTAALELQRRNPSLRVVALQPGTVRSPLSAPFVAQSTALIEPEESVQGMMQAILALEPKSGAHFIDFRGQTIAW